MHITMLKNKGEVQRYSKLVKAQKYAMIRLQALRYVRENFPQRYARQMSFNFDAPQIPELKSPGISAPQDPNHPRAPIGGTSVGGEQYTGGQFVPKEKVEEVAAATGKSKEEVASDIQQGQDPALSPPQQPAPAPEAPRSPYQDVLDKAAPYRQYGENYNRNIAAPANRLEHAISVGHSPKMLEYLADELQMSLDALAKPKQPEKPASAPILTPEQIKERNAAHRRSAAKQQSLLNPKIDAAAEAAPAELPLDADNPREAAAAKQKAQDDDYIYARVSMIGNRGEDLKGAARHKVNAWRGLLQAEQDGTAEALVNRSSLEKVEPYDYTAIAVHNPIGAIAAYLAMRRFPPNPGPSGKHASKDEETAKKDRKQYVDSWMTLKKKLGDIAQVTDDPRELLKRMQEVIAGQINELRGKVPGGISDHYNNTANGLVNVHKALSPHSWEMRKSTNIGRQLGEFASWIQQNYSDVSPDELAERTQEHALQVLEGTSIDKLRGAVKKKGIKGTEFSAADMYVGHAEREGGNPLPARNANESIDYMTQKMGMRGVQFGNSVTDAEREHHGIKSAEAMMDLMDILGLEPDDASIGGKLGFAIGARGHGDALAHYEPTNQIINLTRKGGVGSLAHEWGHFFDHALGGYKSDAYMSRSHTDTHMVTVLKTGHQFTAPHGMKSTNDYTVEPLPHSEIRAVYAKWRQAKSAYGNRLSDVVNKMVGQGYMSRKKGAYWTSTIEVFARSFERYVQRKLEKAGRKNTYLSGVVEGAHTSEDSLWPTDAEVDAMTPAFDEIFAAYAQSDTRKKAKAREQYCKRLSRQLQSVIRYAASSGNRR